MAKRIAAQSPRDGQVHVMPVQGNIYMLVADGTNITASVGRDGIAIVNTGSAQMTDKVLAALAELAKTAVSAPATNTCFGANCPGMPSWSSPTSILSSPHHGRRARCATSSIPARLRSTSAATRSWPRPDGFRRGGVGGFGGGAVRELGETATIVADECPHRDEHGRPQGPGSPEGALPADTFFDDFHKLSNTSTASR